MSTVIPTRFQRDTIYALVEAALEVGDVILVHTEPGHPPIEGTITVESSARNIHTWWNAGINLCAGPTLVLNDDVEATADDLRTLLTALDTADLVWAATGRIMPTPISGWCYGLHPDKIRPDEAFTWFYGDDDLYQRANHAGLTLTPVPVGVIHHHIGEAFADPAMEQATRHDGELYRSRWGG